LCVVVVSSSVLKMSEGCFSLKYLAGAKRQSTDRERACPGDALLLI